MTDVRSGSWK